MVGSFAAGNPAGFHRADGAATGFVVDWLMRLDPVNPQTTARLAATFGSWRMFDAGRQALMRAELERLAALPGLSRDTGEIVGRLLRGERGLTAGALVTSVPKCHDTGAPCVRSSTS